MEISGNIRALLKEKGRPMSWLAEKAGITRGGFSKMLKANTFRSDVLDTLAKVLEVPVSQLLGERQSVVTQGNADIIKQFGLTAKMITNLSSISNYIIDVTHDESVTKDVALRKIHALWNKESSYAHQLLEILENQFRILLDDDAVMTGSFDELRWAINLNRGNIPKKGTKSSR